MITLSDQILLSLGFPLDSRLSNITLSGSDVTVESSSEYLARIDVGSRYAGMEVNFLSPSGTYTIAFFMSAIQSGSISATKYKFAADTSDDSFDIASEVLGSRHLIKDESQSYAVEPNLTFKGALSVSDNPGNNSTDVELVVDSALNGSSANPVENQVITASINTLDNKTKFTQYTTLEDIGITTGEEVSIAQIVGALGDLSELICEITSSHNLSIYPESLRQGILHIIRIDSSYVQITYSYKSNIERRWIASYHSPYTPKFSGWREIILTGIGSTTVTLAGTLILPTISDVAASISELIDKSQVRTIDLASGSDIDLDIGEDFEKTCGTDQAFTISNVELKKPFRLILTGGSLNSTLFTGYTANWILFSVAGDYNNTVDNYLWCEIRSAGQIYLFWGE